MIVQVNKGSVFLLSSHLTVVGFSDPPWKFIQSKCVSIVNLPRRTWRSSKYREIIWKYMEYFQNYYYIRIRVWYCFSNMQNATGCTWMFFLESMMNNQTFILFIQVDREGGPNPRVCCIKSKGLPILIYRGKNGWFMKSFNGWCILKIRMITINNGGFSLIITSILTMKSHFRRPPHPGGPENPHPAEPLGIYQRPPPRSVARYVSNPSTAARRHASGSGLFRLMEMMTKWMVILR